MEHPKLQQGDVVCTKTWSFITKLGTWISRDIMVYTGYRHLWCEKQGIVICEAYNNVYMLEIEGDRRLGAKYWPIEWLDLNPIVSTIPKVINLKGFGK